MVDGRGCGGRGWREGSAIKSTFQFLLNESFSLLFLYFSQGLVHVRRVLCHCAPSSAYGLI